MGNPASRQLHGELIRRATAIVGGHTDDWEIPPVRDAATVILLRESDRGPQVFLQQRTGTMKFAAGMYVFPGGKVEEADADGSLAWVPGPRPEPFERSEAAAATATFRAMTTAGTRETWEEANILLATDHEARSLPKPSEPPEDSAAWLLSNAAVIQGHRLHPWAHWVTPEVERRRFDTRFLIAHAPADQVGQDFGKESVESLWVTPAEAISAASAGQMMMLPPTYDALEQLTEFATVDAALKNAQDRKPVPLLPRPVQGVSGIEWRLVHAYTGVEIRKW